jgi:hypothetical protein
LGKPVSGIFYKYSRYSFKIFLVFFFIFSKMIIIKVKVKLSRYTPWRHMGERRYSSYSFLTSALDGGEWVSVTPRPRFTPGERTS